MGSDRTFSDGIPRPSEAVQELRADAGVMLTIEQVQDLLGMPADEIIGLVQNLSILAVEDGTELVFPAFQFFGAGVWPLLPQVLSAMKGMSPWSMVDQLLAIDPAFDGASLIELVKRATPKPLTGSSVYFREMALPECDDQLPSISPSSQLSISQGSMINSREKKLKAAELVPIPGARQIGSYPVSDLPRDVIHELLADCAASVPALRLDEQG